MKNNSNISNNSRKIVSDEIRELIVNSFDKVGKSVTEISKIYKINKKTVTSIKNVYLKEGRICKKKKGGSRGKVLTQEQKYEILAWVDFDCLLTLPQISTKCFERFAIRPSSSTLSRGFKDFHYSIKRTSVAPARRNLTEVINQRREYCLRYLELIIQREKIYFLDETGFRCSMRMKVGRSKVGHRAVVTVPSLRTKNILSVLQ